MCTFLAWAQNSLPSVVVEAKNLTLPAGSDVVLPCHNQRMVWRQDRLRDRQRVVHWDLIQNQPDYTVERILDMFSGGTERLYNDYNRGRITISKDAFSDGNFSLVINSRFIFLDHVYVPLLILSLVIFNTCYSCVAVLFVQMWM